MRGILILLACVVLTLGVLVSCGEKEKEAQPASGHPEEMADTTRMDSTMMDTLQEAAEGMIDSAAEMTKDVVEDAADAVEEHTGH